MVNKSLSIKGATDSELDAILMRLRKENEVQNLIRDLKRKSMPGADTYDSYDKLQVSTEEPIDSLYHHGILGMKWGIRKDKKSSAVRTPSSDDHNKRVALGSKRVNEMSNAELKALTERMNLEKQLRELSKTEVSPGRKFVTDVLTSAGKQVATAYVAKYLTKGIAAVLKENQPAAKGSK